MTKLRSWLAAAFLALFVTACAPVDITDYTLSQPIAGVLANQNMRIVAADKSFEIVPGTQFTPPFSSNLWGCNNAAYYDKVIVEGYDEARECGAKDVLVYVDGYDKPLYGVLALSEVPAAAVGPAKRSYLIKVPQDKIDGAYAGRTTATYENFNWIKRYDTGETYKKNWRSWILWLSLTPLP